MAKILFISHSSNLGGPTYSLLKLIKHIQHSHQVEIYLREEGDFTEVLKNDRIPYSIFPFSRINVPRLAITILKSKFDLIYGNNLSGPSILALIAARLVGKPFIWHIREMVMESRVSRGTRRKFHLANAIIAVSKACAEWIKPYYPEKEIYVIHNGIETGDFAIDRLSARQSICSLLRISKDSLIILVSGNICERKNQKDCLEVACQLIPRYPFLKMCFLGRLQETEYVNQMKAIANQAGIMDNILFSGFQVKTNDYFCGADILLHTPKKDPHPRVVLEGMAAGLPVVAYAVDGICETVIDNQTGYLVKFGDIKTLTDRMEKLILSTHLRQQQGKAGRERVKTCFTADRTAREVTAVIEKELSGCRRFS